MKALDIELSGITEKELFNIAILKAIYKHKIEIGIRFDKKPKIQINKVIMNDVDKFKIEDNILTFHTNHGINYEFPLSKSTAKKYYPDVNCAYEEIEIVKLNDLTIYDKTRDEET